MYRTSLLELLVKELDNMRLYVVPHNYPLIINPTTLVWTWVNRVQQRWMRERVAHRISSFCVIDVQKKRCDLPLTILYSVTLRPVRSPSGVITVYLPRRRVASRTSKTTITTNFPSKAPRAEEETADWLNVILINCDWESAGPRQQLTADICARLRRRCCTLCLQRQNLLPAAAFPWWHL